MNAPDKHSRFYGTLSGLHSVTVTALRSGNFQYALLHNCAGNVGIGISRAFDYCHHFFNRYLKEIAAPPPILIADLGLQSKTDCDITICPPDVARYCGNHDPALRHKSGSGIRALADLPLPGRSACINPRCNLAIVERNKQGRDLSRPGMDQGADYGK